MLQYSLPSLLGGDLYSSYGYVPSLANVADDPTRGASIRSPAAEPPEWLVNAFQGDFDYLDKWLNALGFGPQQLACLPGCPKSLDAGALEDFLRELRSVQKPERLARFDQAVKTPEPFVSPPCEATRKPLAPQEPTRGRCSPPAGTEEPQEIDPSSPVGDGPGQSCDNEAQDGRPLKATGPQQKKKKSREPRAPTVETSRLQEPQARVGVGLGITGPSGPRRFQVACRHGNLSGFSPPALPDGALRRSSLGPSSLSTVLGAWLSSPLAAKGFWTSTVGKLGSLDSSADSRALGYSPSTMSGAPTKIYWTLRCKRRFYNWCGLGLFWVLGLPLIAPAFLGLSPLLFVIAIAPKVCLASLRVCT